ncbi:MAG: carboxypeptidase regulatory-like domain-containing protein [Calditrichaeota bacterium]|nr:MAG: carboxypeptidase regulatory-like domain-containing protein [Calditrichota bacterium]
MYLNLVLIILTILFSSCSPKSQFGSHFQGVKGKVIYYKGNFMPGSASGKMTPVSRKVIVFKPILSTNYSPKDGVFFDGIKEAKVAESMSDENGNFTIGLPPGKYSILVEEEGKGLYGNSFDGQGMLTIFEIFPNQVTDYNIKLTHEAAF